jgi:hypothetical protein
MVTRTDGQRDRLRRMRDLLRNFALGVADLTPPPWGQKKFESARRRKPPSQILSEFSKVSLSHWRLGAWVCVVRVF